MQTTSVLERKLLLSGFLEAQALQTKSSELSSGVSLYVTSSHWHVFVIFLLSPLCLGFGYMDPYQDLSGILHVNFILHLIGNLDAMYIYLLFRLYDGPLIVLSPLLGQG